MTPYNNAILTSLCVVLISTSAIAVTKQDAGIEVYNRACHTCHAPSVSKALNAPEAFNKKAWQPRLQRAEAAAKQNPTQYKNAEDYLLYQVKHGRSFMQHGGLCKELGNIDCSDPALLDAIHYLSSEQKK